jgi:hypothetical protein
VKHQLEKEEPMHFCWKCQAEFMGAVLLAGLLVCAVVWIAFRIVATVM